MKYFPYFNRWSRAHQGRIRVGLAKKRRECIELEITPDAGSVWDNTLIVTASEALRMAEELQYWAFLLTEDESIENE